MRVIFLTLSLVLTTLFASIGAAQAAAPHVPAIQWESVLGNGSARSVQQTADGGYLVAGWTPGRPGYGSPTAKTAEPGAGTDIFVIKTDGRGRKVWERILPGNGFSTGYGAIPTSDGGALVVGDTKSKTGTDHDVFVAKLDASGNEVWEKNYGGPGCDYGAAVLQTSDGGYLIAGGTESFGTGIYDVYLIRLDAKGRLLWQHTYGGKGINCGYALLQAKDGGYVIAGSSDPSSSGSTNIYLIKVDNNGRLLWERRYGGEYDSYGWSLLQTGNGDYVVAGETEVTGSSGGGYKGCLIETDAQGKEIREQIYGGDSDGAAYAVWPAGDGGYLMAGERDVGGSHCLNITWTNAGGSAETDETLTNLGTSWAYAGQPTGDGGSIVAGERSAAGGGQQILLVKLAPDHSEGVLTVPLVAVVVAAAILALLMYARRKRLL